jgi:transcriptional regulator with XRE-family HTH domain
MPRVGRDRSVDKVIGENIHRRRRAAGMSQTELGNAVGVTFQQIQKYENGLNSVASARVPAVCAALGISIVDLFVGVRMDKTRRGRRMTKARK